MLIDSHVNLHAPQFDEDRDAVISRARDAGVRLMVNICDKLSSAPACFGLAEAHADIYTTVGVHPHEAKDAADLDPSVLVELARHPKAVGIGECGLDFFYDHSPRDIQALVFAAHICAAQQSGLPLVVHTRDADDEMATLLEDGFARAPFKLLLHCYTSGAELARRAADWGAYFSVSGIATFNSAKAVRDIIAEMPEDRLLIETDCPYLAPIPMRGRRNEPAYVGHVARKLADIRGWSETETLERTAEAFFRLFDRIPRP